MHGKSAKPDAVDRILRNKTLPDSVKRRSLIRSESKKCDELSPKGPDADEHQQNKSLVAETSPAGGSASVETFPPYTSKKKMKRSGSCDGIGDSQKYATRVTLCADGREVMSRVPCYSGNVVFPTVKHGQKVLCPICDKVFMRNTTLRNHIVCVHNIIRSGETVYSCIPCKFETVYSYLFISHRALSTHRANLDSLTTSCSQRSFYSTVPRQSYSPKVGDVERLIPRVVWHSQLSHVCSSHCLSGLNTQPPSADYVTSLTLRPRKSLDAPAAMAPTATTSTNTVKESRRLRSSSDARIQKNVTATSVPKSVANKASSPEKTITIIDSDSESEEVAAVENSPSVTQLPNSNKKRTSSGVTKPSTSLTGKQSDSLSMKSVISSGCVNVQNPKSTFATSSHETEALPVLCSGSSGIPSIISILKQNLCKSTTDKPPLFVTTTHQVPESRSGSISVNSPVSVDDKFFAVTSSVAHRSVPVIGVAKAVPAVTSVTQTTMTSNRSMYSLHRFSAETLWSELCRRGGLRLCECGINFMDSTLYLLHRSCHSDLAPLKCAFCDHKAATCYDFHAHLLDHKK